MSRMLTFLGVDALRTGRGVTGMARISQALLESMDALLRRTDVPAELAAPVHRQAANHYLDQQGYRKARLHLRALLRCDRTNAEAFFDLGRAYENDPYGCDQRAVRFYLRAVKLNASEPKYRAVLGRALIRTNSIRSGIKVLCKAASAAPTDSEVMSVVVEGLREAGQAETAYELLSQSLFLAPNNRELKQLWNRTRFDMAQQRQLKQKEELPRPNQTGRILPFVRLNHGSECGIRHDEASSPAPHFLKLPVSRQ